PNTSKRCRGGFPTAGNPPPADRPEHSVAGRCFGILRGRGQVGRKAFPYRSCGHLPPDSRRCETEGPGGGGEGVQRCPHGQDDCQGRQKTSAESRVCRGHRTPTEGVCRCFPWTCGL